MTKTLLKSLREYRTPTLLTLLCMVGEVFIEVLIPFITARLVNGIKAGLEMRQLLITGGFLVLMAMISLCFGTLGGIAGAKASAGYAFPLRT